MQPTSLHATIRLNPDLRLPAPVPIEKPAREYGIFAERQSDGSVIGKIYMVQGYATSIFELSKEKYSSYEAALAHFCECLRATTEVTGLVYDPLLIVYKFDQSSISFHYHSKTCFRLLDDRNAWYPLIRPRAGHLFPLPAQASYHYLHPRLTKEPTFRNPICQ